MTNLMKMILATGNLKTNDKHRGFTLIELMVVMMIIGLLASLVMISFPDSSVKKISHTETRRLAGLVKLASENATLKARAVGIEFSNNSYRFLVRNTSSEWIPLNDKIFRKRLIPNNLQIEIELFGKLKKFKLDDTLGPQVLLSASGEITPFTARISPRNEKAFYQLKAQFGGYVAIEDLETTQ